MGLALSNPNDRRRINAAARIVGRGDMSVKKAVKMILSGASKKQIQKAAGGDYYRGQGTKLGQKAKKPTGTRGENFAKAIRKQEKLKKKGKAVNYRSQIAQAKRSIVKMLMAKAPDKYPPTARRDKNGRIIAPSYEDRFFGSQAARYRVKKKKSAKRVSKSGKVYKIPRGKGVSVEYAYPDGTVVKSYASERATRRSAAAAAGAADGGRGYGHGRDDMPEDIFVRYPMSAIGGKKKKKTKTKSQKAAKQQRSSGRSAGAKAINAYNAALKSLKDAGMSHAEAKAALKQGRDAGMSAQDTAAGILGSLRAANNPGVFGGLALTNPAYDFMGFAKYSATALIAGGVSYKIHEIAVPWVQENVYDRIPVVGEYLNQYPYAATGVIASGALGLVAARVGGVAGMYLGVVAGAVALTGGVLQAQEMFGGESLDVADEFEGDAELAGLAMTNPGVFSGLALENNAHAMGGLALENPHGMAHLNGIAMDNGGFGDGMAYQVAPLGMPDFSEGHSEYSGASLADALISGADLSVDEGNAAVLGKRAYLRRFGRPTVRRYAMGAPRGKSHLAGRPGHRWGWLIKMIGFQRFQALAALPPKKRLAVLKKMRASAIQAYKAEMVDHGVPPAQPQYVSGVTASVPGAANGPDTSYGAMLMASPSYL